jgi:hypothetical protein
VCLAIFSVNVSSQLTSIRCHMHPPDNPLQAPATIPTTESHTVAGMGETPKGM